MKEEEKTSCVSATIPTSRGSSQRCFLLTRVDTHGIITNNTETHGERGNRCRTHECFVTLENNLKAESS
mgnify:CR=1 FL=1